MRVSLLVVTLITTASAIDLKGIPHSRVDVYKTPVAGSSPPRWKCLNSSQEIPHSAVNDNYCDCEDGTDEPGTGACPTGTFYCVNKGHIGAYIRASRVNDGLCETECCDGSDEAPGICPDVCHVAGAEYTRAIEAERRLRKTGSKICSTYIAFAQKEKRRLEQSIQTLLAGIEQKKAEEAKAKEVWEHTASLDEERIQLRKQSPTYTLIKDHVDLLNHLAAKEAALRERIGALERILMNLKAGYNPNYQDMAVLEAVRGWDALKPEEELKSGEGESPQATSEDSQAVETESEAAPVEEVSWTDDRIDDLKATDPLSVLLEHERHVAGSASDDVASALFVVERYLPDAVLPTYEYLRDIFFRALSTVGILPLTSVPGSESEAKKQAYQKAETALRDAQSDLETEQRALEKLFDKQHGFGPRGEWKKLDQTCISKDIGEYTYSLCFFGQATQKSNIGGMSNSLGNFKSWNRDISFIAGQHGYYTKQYYEDGAKCWNGPYRSVKLELSCGTENALLSIAEPEKCEYHFTGTSPALCWPDEELEAALREDMVTGHSKEDF